MNLDTRHYMALEDRHSVGVYAKRPVVFVRGQGAALWDSDGMEYIDCAAGQGVANLGHGHPLVLDAVVRQAQELITCPEAFYNDRRAEYLEQLVSLAPGFRRAFLCNSGTEAVEVAIKYARQVTGRPGVVGAMRGFHGRTFGALSATWNRKYRQPFEPLVPGFRHVPYNDLEALQQTVSEDTAAVLLECVQGEGGVHPGDGEFLQGAARLCAENESLLVIDEVQTGFGRTGRMFAFQHHDLAPDMLCLAKSMAGGLPAGAVLFGTGTAPWNTGMHASTFGGNPLVCAAGLATIQALLEDELPSRAARLGEAIMRALRVMDLPAVREVRGQGLMIGIELRHKAAPFLARMLEAGVVALSAGMTVVRLLPPLVITDSQVDRVLDVLETVLGEDS